MTAFSAERATALEGRPDATKRVARGARRYLQACGFSVVCEAPLPNGRRADLIALAPDGGVRIVEVKSSYADFRADLKWPQYRGFCDRFYFAIPASLDPESFPQDAGLIIADAHGALLAPARRRAMLLRFAAVAANRYCMLAFGDRLAD